MPATPPPSRILILGGGISGLASAFFLARALPATAYITVLEKSQRLGGWIQSSLHHPPTQEQEQSQRPFLLESGPRSIRPIGFSGALTLSMFLDLGLAKSLTFVPKSAPSAQNRFIVYKDKTHLIPTSVRGLVRSSRSPTSPMAGIVSSALRELFRTSRTKLDPATSDTSIAAFLSHRFSPHLVNNLVSAIIHGIYAGDPYALSVNATFPSMAAAEREFGSVVKGLISKQVNSRPDQQILDLLAKHPDLAMLWPVASMSSIYSLRGGLGAGVDALAEHLAACPNVNIMTGVSPSGLQVSDRGVTVECPDREAIHGTHVVAAIPTPSLHTLLAPAAQTSHRDLTRDCHAALSTMSKTPAVTVAVTSIVFHAKDIPQAVVDRTNGFGLLSPLHKGPRTDPHLLGIIFDTCAVPQLSEREYIKFTVMMGGHYFKTSVPSEHELSERALASVRFHLSIPDWIATPAFVRTVVHEACIPQYQVGHVHHLNLARTKLPMNVHLTGSWYSGVGVNDCVKSAWDAANAIIRDCKLVQ